MEVHQLVETAKALKEAGAPTNQVNADLGKLQKQLKAQTEQITNPALGIQPLAVFTRAFWCPEVTDRAASCLIMQRLAGILISIGLMSLGAPFWFDVLKNLLALRPSLASKEAAERTERAAVKTP